MIWTLLLLSGVENGQTVRMPVGKKEVFITFKVRIWPRVSGFTVKVNISQTVVSLFWFEMCSVLAPRSREAQCSGGTEQTSTLTFTSPWHKRSSEEQPGPRVFMRRWIYPYVDARPCLVYQVSELYFKILPSSLSSDPSRGPDRPENLPDWKGNRPCQRLRLRRPLCSC